MCAGKEKVPARRPQGNPSAFVVQRGGIERLGQLTPLGGADRRTIQPVDAMQRRRDRSERPLAIRGVGKRHRRDLARAIVPRDDGISRMGPPVGAVRVGRRPAVATVRPPPWAGTGASIDGLELDPVSGPALTAARDEKGHGRTAVEIGKAEASVVELGTGDGHGGTATRLVQPSFGADERIANERESAPALARDSRRRRVVEEIAKALARARTEIDDAAPRRVPRTVTREVHVDVVFI
jgi:hypothetical protein